MFGFKKKAKGKKGGGLLGVISEHGGAGGSGPGSGGLLGLGSPMLSLIMEPIQIAGASAAIGDADSDFASMFKQMRSARLQARIDALGGEPPTRPPTTSGLSGLSTPPANFAFRFDLISAPEISQLLVLDPLTRPDQTRPESPGIMIRT